MRPATLLRILAVAAITSAWAVRLVHAMYALEQALARLTCVCLAGSHAPIGRGIMRVARTPLAVSCILLCSNSCSEDQINGPEVDCSSPPISFTSARDGNLNIFAVWPDGSGLRRLTWHAAADHGADWYPSREGVRIAYMSIRDGDYEVFHRLISGRRHLTQVTNNAARDGFPRWSPDGSQILFTSDRDGNLELYVTSADGTNPTRLTWNPGEDIGGAWSPDGSKIAFASSRGWNREIYVMRADGTDFIRLTNNTAFELSRVAWSPDGSRIAFDAFLFGNADIYVINVNGTNETQLTHDQAEDRYPMWSPDGQRIGFTSDRDGDDEIYLMDADGTGLVRLTNSPGLDVLDSWRPAQSACHLLSAAILPVYGSVTARWVRP